MALNLKFALRSIDSSNSIPLKKKRVSRTAIKRQILAVRMKENRSETFFSHSFAFFNRQKVTLQNLNRISRWSWPLYFALWTARKGNVSCFIGRPPSEFLASTFSPISALNQTMFLESFVCLKILVLYSLIAPLIVNLDIPSMSWKK